MELTDLEICKRIAEIENVEHLCDRGVVILSENYSELTNTICSGRYSPEQVIKIIDKAAYNPLTDDALCFQLMVKYEIILIPVRENYSTGKLVGYNAFYKHLVNKIYLDEPNPNKAILLAIIEAHNDQPPRRLPA